MGDNIGDVLEQDKDLAKYRDDGLAKALNLPVEGLVNPVPTDTTTTTVNVAPETEPLPEVQPEPVGQKPEIPEKNPNDRSNGLALLRQLVDAEDNVRAETARLNRIVTAQRDNMQKAGRPHIDDFVRTAQELTDTSEAALSEISRLKDDVKYQHKEYLRLIAVNSNSQNARRFSEELASKADPVAQLSRTSAATLLRLDTDLTRIVSGAGTALELYHERTAKARKAYETAATKVETKIDQLDDLGISAATDLRRDLDENRNSAPDDYDAARLALGDLEKRCTVAERDHADYIEQARQTRQGMIKEIKKSMVLPSWWERLGDTWEVKKLFTSKLAQAEQLVDTAMNEDAMKIGIKIAFEAKLIYDDFKGAEAMINDIVYDQSQINSIFATFKDDRPKDFKAIKERYDALEKGWAKEKPSQLAVLYKAFRAEVTGDSNTWDHYKGRCEVERIWREGFNRTATEVQDALDKLDKLIKKALPVEGAEGYQGAARAELRGLKAAASGEMTKDSMAPLTQRINTLKKTVLAYLDVPPSAFAAQPDTLAEPAKSLVVDQKAGAAARQEYLDKYEAMKVAYDKLVDDHIALGKTNLSDDDRREYDDIFKLINKAAVIAKAKKDESDLQDLATAEAMIKRCNDRMALIRSGGPQIDRGKLALLQDDWIKGRAAFESKTKELVDEATRLATEIPMEDDYSKALEKLGELVTTAMTFLNKIDFVQETSVLSDGAPEGAAARKRARETALTKVRLAMDYLNDSPVMETLIANPFKVQGVGTSLFRHLRRIELEVLRGV